MHVAFCVFRVIAKTIQIPRMCSITVPFLKISDLVFDFEASIVPYELNKGLQLLLTDC